MMDKKSDIDTFNKVLEFGAGCFIAGVAVGIVMSIVLGMF